MSEVQLNCSVTVMPIYEGKIGFIHRSNDDLFLPSVLVAPGGKLEPTDGELIDGVPYWSVEEAAIREMKEEAGIDIARNQLRYFCSLTLPNGRVVISMYCELDAIGRGSPLMFLSLDDVKMCKDKDFAPGMREEALLLFRHRQSLSGDR